MKRLYSRPANGPQILARGIVSLLCAMSAAEAADNWSGAVSRDWNDPLNWDGAFPTGNATVNIAVGNTPIISADSLFQPVDIFVGNGSGTVGLLDHRAGLAKTGQENWMYVGVAGGTGTYNLADSSTTGGTLTGMGTGSGSILIGNNGPGGRLYVGGHQNGGGGTGTVNVNTTGTMTIRNDLAIGTGGGTGVMKVDAGTITTGGWNFIGKNEGGGGGNGTLQMSGGTLTNTGRTYVGQSNTTGKIELTGTGKYLNVNNEQFIVGEGAGSNGEIIVDGVGAELRSEGELWIGQGAGGLGKMTVNAGTVSVGNWFAVARDSSTGVLTINGGLVQKTDTDGTLEITNFGSTVASGTVNLNGGTLRVNHIDGNGGVGSTANLFLNGGVLKATVNDGNFIAGNVSVIVKNGGALFDTDGKDITIQKALVADVGSTGGLTKSGNGMLTLTGVNTITGAVAVNGGTLYVNPGDGANNRGLSLASSINVGAGAVLRSGTNGLFGSDGSQEKAITVNAGATLTADGGADVGVSVVTLVGGTLGNLGPADNLGSWRFDNVGDKLIVTDNSTASAVNVKFSNGSSIDVAAGKSLNFTGTITDTLAGGGVSTVIKNGAGRVNFSGVNTYTGSTTINGGTVALSDVGSINNSSAITLNGANTKFIQNSTTAVTPTVTVTNGGVDGTGTINTVTVANLATNSVANGAGTAGIPLTIGSLTFLGAGRFDLALDGTAPGVQTTSFTTSGPAGAVVINASNTLWSSGTTYNLLTFSTRTGALADLSKGTISGLGARQNATLGSNANAITLAITGDLPLWTGAGNGVWSTAVQTPKNWKLQTAGTATDFLTSDVVIFNDTATGTTVTIGENVSPVSTTFDNTTKAYTVTSPGNFGIATGTVTKLGTATLTFGGNHTYTGATNLTAGTTNLTGTLGNTAVTVGGAATLNLQVANAISQNILTVNGVLTQNVANAISGTASVVLNSGGTLTHGNSNTGGITLAGGTLNINHPSGLGLGTFTLLSGDLANTSGGPITVANSNPIRLLTNLNFNGTQPLNLGNGAVTIGADATAQTININNNTALAGTSLTIGGSVSATAGGLAGVKTVNVTGASGTAFTGNLTPGAASGLILNANGAGVLTLSGVASVLTTLNMNGGANSVIEVGAGNLTVSNGGGDVLQSSTGGTINGTGGGTVTVGSVGGDFGTAGGTTLTVNAKLAGTNRIDFYNSNPAPGVGTIILAADNTSTGGVNVENTKVVVPAGGSINGPNAPGGQVLVGTVGGVPATLEVSGGIVNGSQGGPGVIVGVASGAPATLNLTSGSVNAGEVWIANGAGSNGTTNMSGGEINSNGWFVVGRDLGTGTLNFSGGTITKSGNNGNYAIFGSLGGTGTVIQTGGAMNITQGGVRIGENNGNTPSVNTLWDMQAGTATINGEVNLAWRSAESTLNVGANATLTATGRLIVGGEVWNTGANGGSVINGNPVGNLNITGGTATFSGGDSRIGGDQATTNGNSTAGAVGKVNVTSGTLNFGGNLQVGAFGQGTMTIANSGVVNSTAGYPVVGRFAGSVGTMNVAGGTFTQQGVGNFFIVGEDGTGTLNLSGGLVDLQEMRVGHTATGNATVNLTGGVLATSFIQQTNPTATVALKLDGGTLRAKAQTQDFFLGIAPGSISVGAGGAIVDTNGFSIGITQALSSGATNGGLTKKGEGTLTLSGANTYTGPTVIEGGTLAVSGSLSGTAAIDVRTGTTLDVTAIPGGITLGSTTTLKGTGTVLGSVIMSAGSKLSPGASPGTLIISDGLDVSAAVAAASSSALVFELGTVSDRVSLDFGQLTIGTGGLGFNDFVFSNSGGLAIGSYTLFDTKLPIIGTMDSGNLSGALPNGFSGTLGFGDGGNDIVLTVVPEPGSAVLLLGGLGSLVGLRRVRRRKDA